MGRLEAKADRKKGQLSVTRLWAEKGVKWSAARAAKLDAELDRMGRFIGARDVLWSCDTQPEPAPTK